MPGTRAERKILYFYLFLKQKIRKIDSDISGTDIQQKHTSRIGIALKRIGSAALTTIVLFCLVLYLNLGRVFIPKGKTWIEVGLAFLFLLVLFWSHRQISAFFLKKKISKKHKTRDSVLEMTFLIIFTLVIFLITHHIPLIYFFGNDQILPERIRMAYVFSLAVSLFFYYFVERERSKKNLQRELVRSTTIQKETLQAQLESLKQQVNPHFLFNSLNVLGSLIDHDANRAELFTRRLSKLYRSFLKHGEHQLITLRQELSVAESYVYLLETRFGNAVIFRFNIDEKLMNHQLPPGAIQMLLENAIKHNGSTRRKPLIIEINSKGEQLIIKNNLQARKEKIQSTGTGLKNIKSRYQFLSSREIKLEKTQNEFIVYLPLLKPEFI